MPHLLTPAIQVHASDVQALQPGLQLSSLSQFSISSTRIASVAVPATSLYTDRISFQARPRSAWREFEIRPAERIHRKHSRELDASGTVPARTDTDIRHDPSGPTPDVAWVAD